MLNKALNNMRFIYFYRINAILELLGKEAKKRVKHQIFYE